MVWININNNMINNKQIKKLKLKNWKFNFKSFLKKIIIILIFHHNNEKIKSIY